MAARLTAYIVVAIVAGTLIAGLIVGAQRDDSSGPVDLIVFNGRVHTSDGRGAMAEAVAVRGTQILRVGSNREIKRLRRPQTRVIDAHGAAVLPGFVDSHTHLLDGALTITGLNLAGAPTLDDLERLLREFAAATPEAPWIVGRGWSYAAFPGGSPTREVLDRILPDRPAFLVSQDGRAAWTNSRALALARITRRTRSPQPGVIVKDVRTGEPTGLLKERAQELVAGVLPPVTRDDRLRALKSAVAEAHRYGITSVHTATGSPDELALFADIRDAGELKLRVYAALPVDHRFRETDVDQLDAIRRQYSDDPLVKTGGVTLTLDGSVESQTAALLAPYESRPSSHNGRPAASSSGESRPGATRRTGPATVASYFTAEELARLVAMLDRRGWQISLQATGDAAVRLALDALERAIESNPPAGGRRHRIEHAELIDPVDIERFARLGVTIVAQATHPSAEAAHELWLGQVGAGGDARVWPWSALRARGIRIVLGSDWPAAPLDPMRTLIFAVQPADGDEGTELEHGGGLTLPDAIDALTRDAAWASFDEQRKGSIAPGMLADLVILSADVFDKPELLPGAHVEVTIFGGEVVFDRSAEPVPTTNP